MYFSIQMALGAREFHSFYDLARFKGSDELQPTSVVAIVSHWRSMCENDLAIVHDTSSGCVHRPNAEEFDHQKPQAAPFLFVRRGTQSYDESIAAVPLLASPEHDARDDQQVRHFLDWQKRKCDHVRNKTNARQ